MKANGNGASPRRGRPMLFGPHRKSGEVYSSDAISFSAQVGYGRYHGVVLGFNRPPGSHVWNLFLVTKYKHNLFLLDLCCCCIARPWISSPKAEWRPSLSHHVHRWCAWDLADR